MFCLILSLSRVHLLYFLKTLKKAWIWRPKGRSSVASLSSSHVPSLCVLACQCPLVIPPVSPPASPLCSSPSCLGQTGLTVRPMTAWIVLPVSLAAFSITGIWIVWVLICCHPWFKTILKCINYNLLKIIFKSYNQSFFSTYKFKYIILQAHTKPYCVVLLCPQICYGCNEPPCLSCRKLVSWACFTQFI